MSVPATSGSADTAPATERTVERPPCILEFFTVQGTGFRTTAYCDREGKWRDAFTNDELLGEVQILG